MTIPKSRGRLAAIMALGVVAAALPATAFAAPGPVAADGCFDFNEQTGTLVSYNDTGSGGAPCALDVTIPASINGIDVKAIGDHAFAGQILSSVVIPDSVESIGQSAFSNTQLESVDLGSKVKTIALSAFARNDLTVVELPASLTTLGADAFAYNPLTNVSVDGTDLDVPTSAFTPTDGLTITDVAIGAGVRTLAPNVFSAQPVKNLAISEGLESIGASAFNGNRLTELQIPSSVKTVDAGAFDNGTIRNVTVGDGVQSIDGTAFLRNHLETVTFKGNTQFTAELFSQNFTTDEISQAMTGAATPGEGIAKLRDAATLVKVYSPNAPLLTEHGNGVVRDRGAGTFPYGYVINPAAYTVVSNTVDGKSLAADVRHTGTGLTDYRALPALTAGVDSFHRLGQIVDVIPPAIGGYVTPDKGDIQLNDPENRIIFGYVAADGTVTPTPGDNAGGDTPGKGSDDEPAQGTDTAAGDSSATAEDSDLVATGGFDSTPIFIGAVLAMLAGAGALLVTRLRRRAHSAE